MKAAILFILFLPFLSLNAQLSFDQKAPAAGHLTAVNKEWTAERLSKVSSDQLISFSSEEQRIQFHLNQVIALINDDENAELTEAQLQFRKRQMKVLEDYAAAERFPINTRHKVRRPYFVDDFGTACAVGHLALQSGAVELVEKIKSENNFAYIHEMDYPELNAWADENGLSMEDLALIQPAYVPDPTQWFKMGDGSGIEGIISDMEVFNNELILAGSFTSVHGHSANNIVRWNGEEFLNFEVNIEGEIFDVLSYFDNENKLLIAGEFLLNGVRSNIARYSSGVWTSLQSRDMEGAIHALSYYDNNYLVAGGTFNKVDNKDLSFIALYQNGAWTQTPKNALDGPSEEGIFSVAGPVYDLDLVVNSESNKLLVSGDFLEIKNEAANSEADYTQNMAFWNIDENEWGNTFDGSHGAVKAAGVKFGYIFFGGDVASDQGAFRFHDDQIGKIPIEVSGDGQIHDVFIGEHNAFMLGGFESTAGMETFYTRENHMDLFGNSNSALFNNTTHCMAYYDGHYYVTGDFTTINEESYNNLAYSKLTTASSVIEQLTDEQMKIYSADGLIYCDAGVNISEMDLSLYDASGQLVGNRVFENVIGQEVFDPGLMLGVYFYEVRTEEGMKSGKLFLGNGK